MGKMILCQSEYAKSPYLFALSDTRIYSIEELSFYLFEHIYEIYEDFLDDGLIQWIEEELMMEELATKLRTLKGSHNLKDLVVTILCSNDYFTEPELNEIIQIIDKIMELPYLKRQKIMGDNLLKYANYSMAAQVYTSILKSEEASTLSQEEYGNILHNLAITHIHITSYEEAAVLFEEAYNLNQNPASLNQYLLAISLSGKEELFEQGLLKYELPSAYQDSLLKEIQKAKEQAATDALYCEIDRLPELKYHGKAEEYYEVIDKILSNMKKQYRTEMIAWK